MRADMDIRPAEGVSGKASRAGDMLSVLDKQASVRARWSCGEPGKPLLVSFYGARRWPTLLFISWNTWIFEDVRLLGSTSGTISLL